MPLRKVINTMRSRATSDGAGVKISRISGFGSRLNMDPFLMLDEICSDNKDDYVAGFPPHPHRGFETVTYMRAGGFLHEDSMGNTGVVDAGGAQWMTAASGVIHSEMPINASNSRMHGFQLWLNLPAAEKMGQPRYLDIQGEDVVSFQQHDVSVRLIAGEMVRGTQAIAGNITGKTTRALLADVLLPKGGNADLVYAADLSSQFYVYQGSVRVGNCSFERGQLAQLSSGNSLQVTAEEQSGLLLFGGRPLHEPVAHYGPFVMNTNEQIEQAVRDYKAGTLIRHHPA